MTIPTYTRDEVEAGENISYPYNDVNAIYDTTRHQYRLTREYFEERGVNLEKELEGNNPDKIPNFLRGLQLKFYTYCYNHSQSTHDQINYLIAVKGLGGWDMEEYRTSVLEAMFIEGEYLVHNGDISAVSGVDLDTMQNMSADVMREQNRDWHKDAIGLIKTLGLSYYGKYKFIPTGKGSKW